MKNKILILSVLLIGVLFGLVSCQAVTKDLGGTTVINLEPNLKLEEITWKEDSIWYLTKPMLPEDIAETHTFEQQSNFGVFEGKVIIYESKADIKDIEEYKSWNKQFSMSWDEYLRYKECGYDIDDIMNNNIDYGKINEEESEIE